METLKQYTILVAEDDEDIRSLLKLYLESSGFRVILAEDGRKAMREIEKEPVDLALLDDSREDLLEGCAVFGNRVLYVQYFSHDAGADQLLETMAQALCAP